jgi:outer membrane protein assembly factor BamB
LWSVSLEATRVLAADDSTVYAATADDNLRAVDRTSRKNRWPVPTPYVAPIGETAEAVANGGYLVVSSEDGTVFAFNFKTGKKAWELSNQNKGSTLAPVINNGTVYLGGSDLLACRLSDGQKLWQALGTWGPPILDGYDVLAMAADDYRYPYSGPVRISADTGSENYDWYAQPKGDNAPLVAPVIQGHSLWMVEGGDIKGVTARNKTTGDAAWTYRPKRGGTWRMAAAGNRVCLLNGGEAVAMPVF